jgi:hypothetical protein
MRRRIHACHMRRRIHVCHMRRRIHVCHMRRRIHVCHMRRRIHVLGRYKSHINDEIMVLGFRVWVFGFRLGV